MPYIVTTKTPALDGPTFQDFAVATLEEARERAAETIGPQNTTDAEHQAGAIAPSDAYDEIGEPGGTITLPDGTVIVVLPLPMTAIRADLEDADPGWAGDDALALATWCDLFDVDGPSLPPLDLSDERLTDPNDYRNAAQNR